MITIALYFYILAFTVFCTGASAYFAHKISKFKPVEALPWNFLTAAFILRLALRAYGLFYVKDTYTFLVSYPASVVVSTQTLEMVTSLFILFALVKLYATIKRIIQ